VKTKIVILVFILSFGNLSKAQNFVNNGYFEIYSQCPNTSTNYISYAVGWTAAAYTPDYCNSCSNNNTFSVPYNSRGYQQDCCGGGGYAGIEVFGFNPGYIIREYIQTKLIDTLKAGHKYLASMYVNRANDIDYAIATMGILFTDTVINLPSPKGFVNANPQVKNTTLLTDTVNWMVVQDTFIAIGNEVYLTIGNFSTDSLSDTVKVGGNGTYSGFTYYYIDGVSVYDVATLGIEQNKNKVEVSVYPNPASNKINIEAKEVTEIKVFDLLGKEIISTKEKEVDISNLNNGVYFIQLQTKQNTYTQKIIVQH
jgi:hypothetical protein